MLDTCKLLGILRDNKEFKNSLELSIRDLRDNQQFKIIHLIDCYLAASDATIYYFIIHKKNQVVSCLRLYHYNKKAYINMVYTANLEDSIFVKQISNIC